MLATGEFMTLSRLPYFMSWFDRGWSHCDSSTATRSLLTFWKSRANITPPVLRYPHHQFLFSPENWKRGTPAAGIEPAVLWYFLCWQPERKHTGETKVKTPLCFPGVVVPCHDLYGRLHFGVVCFQR